MNAAECAALALNIGIAEAQIESAVADFPQLPGRLERFKGDEGVIMVVDYAHTPDALANALAALRPHVAGRLICVFGCGGDRDAGKRPDMAREAEKLADRVVVTDDNPRGEDPGAITRDILAGFSDKAPVTVINDRALAILSAIRSATPNDLVLIAGKGHEAYQEVAGQRYPFSDAEQVRHALELNGGVA